MTWSSPPTLLHVLLLPCILCVHTVILAGRGHTTQHHLVHVYEHMLCRVLVLVMDTILMMSRSLVWI